MFLEFQVKDRCLKKAPEIESEIGLFFCRILILISYTSGQRQYRKCLRIENRRLIPAALLFVQKYWNQKHSVLLLLDNTAGF